MPLITDKVIFSSWKNLCSPRLPLLYSDEHLVRPSTNSQSGVRNNQSSTPEDLARVSDQSRSLYLDFLQRQIREDEQQRSLNTSGYSYDPSDSDLSNLLRRFAQSEERQIIRQQANEVPLDSVSVENFTELLSGLFGEDGIVTYERVLVLFYFCFELCVRAIREYSSRYFHTVMDVCLRFVTGSLSIWVCAQGGWNAICNTVQHKNSGMKCSLVSGILLLTVVIVLSVNAVQSKKVLMCYYSSWSYFRNGKGQFSVSNIDPYLCTHLIYAFIGVNNDGTVRVMDPYLDLEENNGLGNFKKFNELRKQNSELKTLVAIGGWNEGSTVFSNVVKDANLRSNFVDNLYNFVKRHDFSGLDLDWEYPAQRGGVPEDKQNFVYLVQELKQKFAPEGLLLTAAVHAAVGSVAISYDIPELVKNLDFINMMSYDYHGSWDSTTGINSPMYPSHIDSDLNLNIDATIQFWLNNGCPPEKLVLGAPTFGRTFNLANPNSPGLGAVAIGPGVPGPYTMESGFMAYFEICELQYPGLWSINWAAQQKVPFAFKSNLWVGYENPESMKIKAEYANTNNLGGVLAWGLETDDFFGSKECNEGKYPLITAMKNTLN
ncbi:Hypothetical predicted protein [Cloeon dipterum]|uniref:GH18 domain-containing protein n=1 Tax=Cloeon dipterum TaxID=197152 RepID=A0A8S1CMV3_9INSE|nr:Hypothetical predicted protein [Cloeon dipterum]